MNFLMIEVGPATEGFYDTALNEGRCTNSEVKTYFARILVYRSNKGAMKWTV